MIFIILVALLFSLVIIILLLSISLSFYYENHRSRLLEEEKSFLGRNNFYRTLEDNSFSDISYEEYKQKLEDEKGDFAKQTETILGDNEKDMELAELELLLDYYWYCKEDLTVFKDEVIALWKRLFKLIEKYKADYSVVVPNLHFLVRISRLSKLSKGNLERIDNKLLDILETQYRNRIKEDFIQGLDFTLRWYAFRMDTYYRLMGIGSTERELYFLKNVWEKKERDMTLLKIEYPAISIGFYHAVKYFYEHLPKIRDYSYERFYKEVLVWISELLRKEGKEKELSDAIITRRKIEKRGKKGFRALGDNILDYGTGYGERPERIIGYFVIVNLIFMVIFYPCENSIIELEGISESNNIIENLVDVLYFNLTTMISNVYGNITPQNSIAKLFVLLQQLIGFILTGSFIALSLRKIFRD